MADQHTPTLRQVIASVLWSFLGVQSERNRARDFTHGKPGPYIAVGLALTALFVLLLWGVVRLVTGLAAP